MKRSTWIILIITAIVSVCCCIIIVAAGFIGFSRFTQYSANDQKLNQAQPTSVWISPQSTVIPRPGQPAIIQPTPNAEQQSQSQEMLTLLDDTNIPIANLVDLADRLQGKENIPLTLPAPLSPLTTGTQEDFWVTNTDSNITFQISATLEYVTDHVYFWVEDGINFNMNDLKKLTDTFESRIYPTDRAFFGSEWTPGVDNDPHLYILLGSNLGNSLAGYFSSFDEYTPQAHKYSNGHEMFILNADGISLGQQYTYGVLAHEFQHMIHWYRDLNEDTWLNEGFSELAVLINGYDPGGFDYAYTSAPDLQLNDWASSVGANDGHYGASFLFITYFLDRFGEEATKTLVGLQENGLESIDKVLSDLKETDPLTGSQITANDLFADWAVTNFVDNTRIGDGRYGYKSYTGLSPATYTDLVTNCNSGGSSTTVSQYGVDYIQFECSGPRTIRFQGTQETKILKDDPFSGNYAFWSFKGDESDMTLTRTFDFTNVTGPIQMDYHTWYDLEQDYDYAYVEVSEDGSHWTFLITPSGTDKDVSGNSFGWGYNGNSGGWIDEQVDLSDYAGKKVQVRFEYITDAAVNGDGLMVDDISIPAIHYSEDFEKGDGGWDAAGFVRIANRLPQTYKVSLITFGAETKVIPIELDANNQAEIPVDFSGDIHKAVLVVSGTTEFTRQPADYSYSIR